MMGKQTHPSMRPEQPRLPLPPGAVAAASKIGLNSDIPFSGE
jgi:hypothetical protein